MDYNFLSLVIYTYMYININIYIYISAKQPCVVHKESIARGDDMRRTLNV